MVFVLQFLQKKRPLYELYKYTHTNKHTYIHRHACSYVSGLLNRAKSIYAKTVMNMMAPGIIKGIESFIWKPGKRYLQMCKANTEIACLTSGLHIPFLD